MTPILQVRDATKLYKNNRGITDVSLELHPGDVYGLFGPNGTGKTTLLKMITGLIRADRGSVVLFGHNLAEQFEPAMRRVGCMIESADFYDYTTAFQHLRLAASYYPGIGESRIEEVLETVGLHQYRMEKIKHFSQGMKQKLALAAAILSEPELVILDEPTNGLDIESMVGFRNLVKRLAAEKQTAFIISSHQIHELEMMCNRLGIMHNGKLIKEAYMSDLSGGQQSLEQFYLDQLQRARGEGAHV